MYHGHRHLRVHYADIMQNTIPHDKYNEGE